jgi:hypothetical protein
MVEVSMVVVAIFVLLIALNPKAKVFSVLGLVIVIFRLKAFANCSPSCACSSRSTGSSSSSSTFSFSSTPVLLLVVSTGSLERRATFTAGAWSVPKPRLIGIIM